MQRVENVVNMEEVKRKAKMLLSFEPRYPNDMCKKFGVVAHPFFNANCVYTKDNEGNVTVYDVMEKDGLEKACKLYVDWIDKAEKVDTILLCMQKHTMLYFLQSIKSDVSIKEFSRLFGETWVVVENPSQDGNVKIPTLVKWFKEADKRYLMRASEYEHYNAFPDQLEVYRGVALGRNPRGLSWTPDRECAEWFAHRFDRDGKTGYVQKLTVNKSDILAYFEHEDECVIDTRKHKEKIVII